MTHSYLKPPRASKGYCSACRISTPISLPSLTGSFPDHLNVGFFMAGSSAQPASTPHPGCEQLLPKAFCIRHMLSKRIPFPGQGYGSLHPVTTACCFDCCCLLESPFSLCANYIRLASAFESKPKLRVSFAALSRAAGTSQLGKADALPVTARPLVIITRTLSLPSQHITRACVLHAVHSPVSSPPPALSHPHPITGELHLSHKLKEVHFQASKLLKYV